MIKPIIKPPSTSDLNVLFLGSLSGTSLDRAKGLGRLGCNVTAINPRQLLPNFSAVDRIEWHLSPSLLATVVRRRVWDQIKKKKFDLIFVDSGSLISRSLIEDLKSDGAKAVNYNHDDPFGPRDWTRFSAYRRAVPAYDLIVVVRPENISEAYNCGAQNVLHLLRLADEVAHAPRHLDTSTLSKWNNDVVFIGTWMPERGPFIMGLIERGVNVKVFGSGWKKAPEWSAIKTFVSSKPLVGDDYAHAIQCSKICLGFLSKENRDLHTTRSLEIPSLGGLLCAERTSEHLEMYKDGVEAVFWSDVDECASICKSLLNDEAKRKRIAMAGRDRFLQSGNSTENMLRKVISELWRQ